MRAAHYVIYQSPFCRESADRYLGPAVAPCAVRYNCVDIERFRPPAAPLPPELWTLLSAGTHQQRDRILSVLATVALLREQRVPLRLLLAGVPNCRGRGAGCRPAARPQGRGGDDRPLHAGDGRWHFRRAHVLLHPQYKDPSPTVPLEGMASGGARGRGAERSGGMPELVGQDGGSWWTSSWDVMHVPGPAAMGEALRTIMADWERWSQTRRQRAAKRFGKDAWVRRHREISVGLLGDA